jgi:spore germination cell wall hydrolase CwlJ-like protein
MEARGESLEGQRAVVHVLFNRRDFRRFDRWNCIAQVCLDWLQFSGWRDSDPNFVAAMQVDLNLETARTALVAFLEGWTEHANGLDPTQRARHYHATSVSPRWANGHTPILALGAHRFYNDVA